jgi:hypothetical protein
LALTAPGDFDFDDFFDKNPIDTSAPEPPRSTMPGLNLAGQGLGQFGSSYQTDAQTPSQQPAQSSPESGVLRNIFGAADWLLGTGQAPSPDTALGHWAAGRNQAATEMAQGLMSPFLPSDKSDWRSTWLGWPTQAEHAQAAADQRAKVDAQYADSAAYRLSKMAHKSLPQVGATMAIAGGPLTPAPAAGVGLLEGLLTPSPSKSQDVTNVTRGILGAETGLMLPKLAGVAGSILDLLPLHGIGLGPALRWAGKSPYVSGALSTGLSSIGTSPGTLIPQSPRPSGLLGPRGASEQANSASAIDPVYGFLGPVQ